MSLCLLTWYTVDSNPVVHLSNEVSKLKATFENVNQVRVGVSNVREVVTK